MVIVQVAFLNHHLSGFGVVTANTRTALVSTVPLGYPNTSWPYYLHAFPSGHCWSLPLFQRVCGVVYAARETLL